MNDKKNFYVTNKNGGSFDPMNVNFGIFEELEGRVHKKERKAKMGERAINTMKELIEKDYILD